MKNCTCEWWDGFIAWFNPYCPRLRDHRGVPWNLDQLRLF